MLVVLRFSKLNGQMNSKDLAMVGGFLFSFFFASSLDTVSLAPGFGLASKQKRQTRREEVRDFCSDKNRNVKNSEKGVGGVSEESRL